VASSSKQRVTHNRSVARAAECDVTIVHLDAVQRVRAVLPDEMVMQRVAATFQILADPVRASIIYALAHQELCVCDVAVVARLSISAASHQLKRLRDQDVVAYRKEGRLAFYSLRDERMRRLIEDGLAHAQSRQ
jgi:ArsR family transcriptional regulator, lead/cadmium/zinc/bismuth-responsive transcriptional repressor